MKEAEFASLMDACGPYEDQPHMAVGLSGGADSLALTLLLDDWVKGRSGRLTALIVDHRLRPESTREARRVADWMRARDIEHVILTWKAEKPSSGLMAAARAARYELLRRWCREMGVLHLVLAHHREDQAATFLLNLKRGSGLEGLSAMKPVSEGFPRLLRPLLPITRDRLRAYLQKNGQDWIEDPTNRNLAFDRNRADAFLSAPNSLGLSAGRIALAAQSLARARDAVNKTVAEALARSAGLSPLGVGTLDPRTWRLEAEEVRLRSLARLLVAVGGGSYTPRFERLRRLHDAILEGEPFKARTLAGCRISARDGRLLIVREARAIDVPHPVPGTRFLWDGRFAVGLDRRFAAPGVMIGRLTTALWRRLTESVPAAKDSGIPAHIRATLPVLWRGDQMTVEQILAAPHVGYVLGGTGEDVRVAFSPRRSLT